MAELIPLRRRRGRIEYKHLPSADAWGFEEWSITRGSDDLRVLVCHCEMRLGSEEVARDSILSVHPDFHPQDAFVRIMNRGELTGSGWFHFTDSEATSESFTSAEGRISQVVSIERPIRSFGVHAVQSDGWLAGNFPYAKGEGHTQFYGHNLLHSTHHFGATGPMIATTRSGLQYLGIEEVEVPAGRFQCHKLQFVALSNAHPPYEMWVTTDGDFLYVKGVVGGYMDSSFELVELDNRTGL